MKTHTIHPQTEAVPSLVIHPSISPLAAELLLKTAEVLLRTPEKYNQSTCNTECGSPCCIIGHALIISGKYDNKLTVREAAEIIGLSLYQTLSIYDAHRWPTPNNGLYATPAQGIARIEWMLTTGT